SACTATLVGLLPSFIQHLLTFIQKARNSRHTLRQRKVLAVAGAGVSLRSQLMALGLVDEIHIVIHPVIIGEGKKLMEDFPLQDKLNWKLVDTKVFKSGCVGLHYLKG
ncbi:dihydrofolate reductase family protein, partial [Mucilaginibacter sp. OK283]|uniref:dihydrofolate reductase family protein n=1 Tax=Mucilaginibacter sp. OK283 TaxID=1881049 RepID=UPI0008D75627